MEAYFGSDNLLGKDGEVSVASLSDNEVVGIYFSAHWCPPCKGFTPKLAEFYKNFKINSPGRLEVVFVSSDKDQGAFDGYYGEMPWLALPFAKRDLKDELSSKFGVQGIPTFVLLNAKTGELITKKARNGVMSDPEGTDFPWIPPTVKEMLDVDIIDNTGALYKLDDFSGKYKLLYFSAHWCGPCRNFTPMLRKFYEAQASAKNFEIIFVSSDRDQEGFDEYFGEMPWKAIQYSNDKSRSALGEHFEVQGIPSLVVLDANLEIITSRAVGALRMDEEGADFPWIPKLCNQLNGYTAMTLNEKAGLVLLAESNPEDVEALKGVADSLEEKGEESNINFFYVDEAVASEMLVGRVKELSGVKDGVRLFILDIPKGRYTHYSGSIIDSDSIKAFLKDYNDGTATFVPLG